MLSWWGNTVWGPGLWLGSGNTNLRLGRKTGAG